MKKLIISILILTFFIISCHSSKKTENNDADLLADEDVTDADENDEEVVEPDDEDKIEDTDPCDHNPCENIANSDGTCTGKEDGTFECGCVEGYFWGHSVCKKIILSNICSGQTKCYDLEKEIECPAAGEDFYGQDAQYAKLGYCLSPSFTVRESDEGEKTVIDNNTGLEWQQKAGPVDKISWEEAYYYCENSNYGGYHDWRVPTVTELSTILHYDNSPTIDLQYFPDTPLDNFWTSSGYSQSYRFTVDYQIIINFEKADKSAVRQYDFIEPPYPVATSVRCVRGKTFGTEIKENFMVDLGEDTFEGNPTTNLIWKNIEGNFDTSLSWAARLKYCEELDFIGISDWRLPNVRELETISADETHFYTGSSSTTFAWSPEEHFGVVSYKDDRYLNYACITENPCAEDKIWNGEKCVENPCLPNPCKESESSTNMCVFNFSGKRSCYCQYGYEWNGEKLKCVIWESDE